jgi:hypothetical protein
MVGLLGFVNFDTEKYYLERIENKGEEDNVIPLSP